MEDARPWGVQPFEIESEAFGDATWTTDWGRYFAAALVDALKARGELAARLPPLQERELLRLVEHGLRHVVDGRIDRLRLVGDSHRLRGSYRIRRGMAGSLELLRRDVFDLDVGDASSGDSSTIGACLRRAADQLAMDIAPHLPLAVLAGPG